MMQAVSGVFQSRQDAQNAINELRRIGIADNRLGLVIPGADSDDLEAGLPVTDTERPGMGKAMGAAVFSGMIGVTLFGLLLTPVFYVLVRRASKSETTGATLPAPNVEAHGHV